MKLKDFPAPLAEFIESNFPNASFRPNVSTREFEKGTICDSFHGLIIFTPKDQWAHGIWRNAPHLQFTIFPFTHWEENNTSGIYKFSVNGFRTKEIKCIFAKKGTLEQIQKHIENYLKKNLAALQ